MKTPVDEIHRILRQLFLETVPPLRIRKDLPGVLEVCGTKETMQGKQKVDGYYFGSVVPKPKDIRLYFFPIYTHPEAFADLNPQLRKMLKGKSCFHITRLDTDLEASIRKMLKTGISCYQEDQLI